MKGRIKQWIGYVIMLIGLAFLVGPFLTGAIEEKKQVAVADEFSKITKRDKYTGNSVTENDATVAPTEKPGGSDNNPEDDSTSPDDTQSTQEPDNYIEQANVFNDEFYRKAYLYNQMLSHGGQDHIKGLSDLEKFDFSAKDYGYGEDIIGTIYVPRLDINLGIYLGASKSNMAKGTAIFGNTSIPLGAGSENVAIAGHRGWKGTPVFRDIQTIQINDPIYITTYWDTLVYRVCELRIVPNDDNDWYRIQDGRSLITLMTCHPYHKNYQRYIVFAELADEKMPSREEILLENERTYSPIPKEITEVLEDGSIRTVTVSNEAIEPDGTEYGAVWSNTVIIAESRMKIVAYIFSVLVAIVGIYLIVGTIKDIKNSKGKQDDYA